MKNGINKEKTNSELKRAMTMTKDKRSLSIRMITRMLKHLLRRQKEFLRMK